MAGVLLRQSLCFLGGQLGKAQLDVATDDGPAGAGDRMGDNAECAPNAQRDTMWQQAIEAGAEEVFPLETQFYGERGGRVRDPFGHTWGISMRIEEVDDEEMRRRTQAFYNA